MLTNASRLSARSRHARAAALGSLGPASTRSGQPQTRHFCFGRVWSLRFDSDSARDTPRRHRRPGNKFSEPGSRRLPWEKQPSSEDVHPSLRRMVHDCWRPTRSHQPDDWYMGSYRSQSSFENPSGTRPGRNIEDAERGPMEHLIFGNQKSTLWDRGSLDLFSPPSSTSRSSPSSKHEYIIDPITNRKIPKPSAPTNSARNSQLAAWEATPYSTSRIDDNVNPIFYDGVPTEQELKRYDQVPIDPKPWEPLQAETAVSPADNALEQKFQPILESEEYVKDHLSTGKPTISTIRDEFGPLETSSDSISWYQGDGILPANSTTMKSTSGVSPSPALEYFGSKSSGPYRTGLYDEAVTTEFDVHSPKYYDLGLYGPVSRDTSSVAQPTRTSEGQRHANLDSYTNSKPQKLVSEPFIDEPAPAQDLQGYKPFLHNEPDGKPAGAYEGQEVDPEELSKYQAFRYNEPDGKPMLTSEEGNNYDPAELRKYNAFRYNEPDGKPLSMNVVTSEPEPGFTEDEWAVAPPSGSTAPFKDASEQNLVEGLNRLHTSDTVSAAGNGPYGSRNVLDSMMDRHAASSDAVDAEAVAAIRASKADADPFSQEAGREIPLTGTYAKDFPGGYATSWAPNAASANPSPLPEDGLLGVNRRSGLESVMQNNEREQREPVTSRNHPGRLQSALDRHNKHNKPRRQASKDAMPVGAASDPYSKFPQGLETSYSEECAGQSTRPTFAHHYTKSMPKNTESTVEGTDTEPSASVGDEAAEPNLYRILAYDPTMQVVNTAETTSIVSDHASPLTPDDVLLRLSNPAKFFPYFAPLKAQGFEIVSGSGDVLVFRKVHPGADPNVPDPSVNPIDKTGGEANMPSPATSRFASPTGFVNYELPSTPQSGQESKSSIPRRQEPVFSGSKAGQRPTSKSIPKRIVVGAAWLAGISYALGVVGEYFKTGGTDGKGPSGL